VEKITHIIVTGILATLAGAQAWAVNVASCPFAISAPGNYVVAANLTCPAGNGITITASNVSLNLNGHIITGSGSGVGILVSPTSGRLNHVGISGPGLIRTFTTGIEVSNTDDAQVSLVTVAGNPTGVMGAEVNRFTVGSNVIARSSIVGLGLQFSINAAVTGNQVVGNGRGIVLFSGSANTLSGNTVSGNSVVGIGIAEKNSRVSSNITNGNGTGIEISPGSSGNKIFSNTSSVGNTGFDLEDPNAFCDGNFWSSNVFFTKNQACVN
jgi:parallel beta-helix repeat protein